MSSVTSDEECLQVPWVSENTGLNQQDSCFDWGWGQDWHDSTLKKDKKRASCLGVLNAVTCFHFRLLVICLYSVFL